MTRNLRFVEQNRWWFLYQITAAALWLESPQVAGSNPFTYRKKTGHLKMRNFFLKYQTELFKKSNYKGD